jgi:predicted transcriptional regulator
MIMAKDKKVKPVHIRVEPLEKAFARFEEAWESAAGGSEQSFGSCISFENFTALLAVLTPKRMTLLQTLRQKGPMSIRALAKSLSRDYKNVHADVKALEAAGLLEQNQDGKIFVPWDEIDARLSLVA